MLPFGAIPVQWALEVGPVLVARLDQKPLHPLHAAAICAFCARYLRVAFQECIDAERSLTSSPNPPSSSAAASSSSALATGSSSHSISAAATAAAASRSETIYERRRTVLALVTSGSFAEFFEQYKARRVRGRPDFYVVDDSELDHMRRMERWSIPPDEIEPRPEWEDVPSPFDV
jgi:hypothetical protein